MSNTATTITKTVSSYSPDKYRTLGRIYLPREFIGKEVIVTLKPEPEKE